MLTFFLIISKFYAEIVATIILHLEIEMIHILNNLIAKPTKFYMDFNLEAITDWMIVICH